MTTRTKESVCVWPSSNPATNSNYRKTARACRQASYFKEQRTETAVWGLETFPA